MIKKHELKKLFFQILIILILFVSFKYIFTYLNSTNKNKISSVNNVNKKSQQEVTLRNVEKINAYIEEQNFLFSTIQEKDIKIEPLLIEIKKNLLLIEEEAKNKSVYNLINKTEIEEIKNNLISYQQILKKEST